MRNYLAAFGSEPRQTTHRIAFIALGLAAPAAGQLEGSDNDAPLDTQVESTPISWSIGGAWESHYVSEGRDNLLGGSLLSTTVDASYRQWFAGAWYARNPDGRYDELNLFFGREFSIGSFDLYAAYTHLRFFEDAFHDHEIGFGAVWTGLPYGFTPAIDAYYSFDADRRVLNGRGWFVELSVRNDYVVADWLTLSPSVVLGINHGYISRGHDGFNHLAFRLDASVPIKRLFALSGYLAWNQGINRDTSRHIADRFMHDFLYGGVSATVQF